MDLRADAFLAGGPDPSSVILNYFPYNGKADAASAFRGIPGRVRPVKPVEDIGQILCGDAFAVIFDFNFNEIAYIFDPNINDALFLVQVFHGIADNVVDYPPHLLGIGDHHYIFIRIIKVSQLDSLGFHIQAHFLNAVLKVLGHIDFAVSVGDFVGVNLGVEGQLVISPSQFARQ